MEVAFVWSPEAVATGSGGSERSSFWRQTLSVLGDLTTIEIPEARSAPGPDSPRRPADAFGDVLVIEPFDLSHAEHPKRARRTPEYLGARWIDELPPFELIVGLGADVAPFCIGLALGGSARVVIELDDDNVDHHENDAEEADRHRSLIAEIRQRVDLVLEPADTAAASPSHDLATMLERLVTPPRGPQRVVGAASTETDSGLVVEAAASGLRHHLDPTSAIVYSMSDGATSITDMADVLGDVLSWPPDRALRRVIIALDQLVDAGIVGDDPTFERHLSGGRRRFRLRPGTFDHNITDHVYSGNEYSIPGRLPPCTAVIDVGAHIGSFSALMLDSGADFVLAIEPQPDNVRLASMNLASEIEQGRVELRHTAIWNPPAGQQVVIGSAPLYSPPGLGATVNTGGHESRKQHDADGELRPGETVAESDSLDGVIALLDERATPYQQLWLKLDCEGGEWGALETSDSLDRVDTIVAEMHLDAGGSPDRLGSVVEKLEANGFEVTTDRDPTTEPRVLLRADRHSAAPRSA